MPSLGYSLKYSLTTNQDVVQQATIVVDERVRSTVVDALRAAELCGCYHCRVQAAQTMTWAASLLGSDRLVAGQ